MHPRVEIGCAEAPQFPYPHSAYLALADETLKCFRVDLQQGCRLARIEEPLEMRDRLADWRYFVHLAHKTPTARVETGLKSRHRLKAGCGVWLRSTDFEPIHYSAGISLRVMGGREQIRKKTAQDAFVASFQRILFFCRLRNNFSRSA